MCHKTLESAILEGMEVKRFKRNLLKKTGLVKSYLGITKYTIDALGEGTAHLGLFGSKEEYHHLQAGQARNSSHQTKKIFDLRDIKGFVYGNGCFRQPQGSPVMQAICATNCFTIVGKSRSEDKSDRSTRHVSTHSAQGKAGEKGGGEKFMQFDLVLDDFDSTYTWLTGLQMNVKGCSCGTFGWCIGSILSQIGGIVLFCWAVGEFFPLPEFAQKC